MRAVTTTLPQNLVGSWRQIRSFADLWTWACDPRHQWRSWVAHGLLVITLALPLPVGVALGYYFLREVEQGLVVAFVEHKQIDWRDAIADFAVAMWMLTGAVWLFHLT